jgi:hypothetical protein
MSKNYLVFGLILGGLVLAPGASIAAALRMCPVEAPAPNTTNWNFQREASQVLHQVQKDAASASINADHLKTVATDQLIDWQVDAMYLSNIRDKIQDMDQSICRLAAIRRVTSPEQQHATRRAAVIIQELSVNADGAIRFMKQNRRTLWKPAYRTYTKNVYVEARQLDRMLKHPAVG